ncbi:22140_t:CDS:1, partial [Dentiscutata erythropus]
MFKGSKQPVSCNLKHRKIIKIIDNANGILAKQDQSVTTIRIVKQFVEFYKVQDFGVVKIITDQSNTLTTDETIAIFQKVIHGLKELQNLILLLLVELQEILYYLILHLL